MEEKVWFEIEDLAERFHVTRVTIYNWVRSGMLIRERHGHVTHFRVAPGYREGRQSVIVKDEESC